MKRWKRNPPPDAVARRIERRLRRARPAFLLQLKLAAEAGAGLKGFSERLGVTREELLAYLENNPLPSVPVRTEVDVI